LVAAATYGATGKRYIVNRDGRSISETGRNRTSEVSVPKTDVEKMSG
jgi:hypothetical protein